MCLVEGPSESAVVLLIRDLAGVLFDWSRRNLVPSPEEICAPIQNGSHWRWTREDSEMGKSGVQRPGARRRGVHFSFWLFHPLAFVLAVSLEVACCASPKLNPGTKPPVFNC